MLVGEAAPSGPVGRKVLASRAGRFFASPEAFGGKPLHYSWTMISGYAGLTGSLIMTPTAN